MTRRNMHGSALVLGDRGLLIAGRPGAGKTTLALLLIGRARSTGCHGVLVADDQVYVEHAGARIIARAPAAIAGLAERRGAGPLPVECMPAAVIDAMIELVPAAEAPRLETVPWASLADRRLPRLRLAANSSAAAALAVEAWMANGFSTPGDASACGKMATHATKIGLSTAATSTR